MEYVIEIMKESSVFLCRDLPMHMFITLVLIFPVSSLTLSQVLMNRDIARKIEEAATWLTLEYRHITNNNNNNNNNNNDTSTSSDMKNGIGSLDHTWADGSWCLFERLVYGQVLETLAAQAVVLPVVLTLGMLAKVAAWHVMGARWEGRRARLDEALSEGPRAWARLVSTHVVGLGLVCAVAVSAMAVRGAGVRMAGAVGEGAGRVAGAVLDSGLAAILVLLLPHALTVLHLSVAVAGLHGSGARSGLPAILAALALLKRRRIRPALLLFLLSCSASAAIEFIFQIRVLGRSYGYANSGAIDIPPGIITTGSLHRLLEAPILVFAHAFLALLDTIASFCFFNACTQASVQEYMILISNSNSNHHHHHHHHLSSSVVTAFPSHSAPFPPPHHHHAFHIPDLDLIHQHHHHHNLSHDDDDDDNGHIVPLQCDDDDISSDQLYQEILHGDDDDDHFSAAVNMLEKHCRKLYKLYISSSSSSNFA